MAGCFLHRQQHPARVVVERTCARIKPTDWQDTSIAHCGRYFVASRPVHDAEPSSAKRSIAAVLGWPSTWMFHARHSSAVAADARRVSAVAVPRSAFENLLYICLSLKGHRVRVRSTMIAASKIRSLSDLAVSLRPHTFVCAQGRSSTSLECTSFSLLFQHVERLAISLMETSILELSSVLPFVCKCNFYYRCRHRSGWRADKW